MTRRTSATAAPANLSALLVPAALAAPPGGTARRAWIVSDRLGPLTARVGSGAAAAILPDTPTVLEVLAATGAASASLASRTWLREDLANGAAPLLSAAGSARRLRAA